MADALDLSSVQATYTICPICGWKSDESPVDRDNPNGVWFSKRLPHEQYRRHYDNKHRALPLVGFCYTHNICKDARRA